MTKLFSYVVDHDLGYAPNPSGGFCSLAKCKYGKKKRNIVEIAEEGDWVVGTGGANLKTSAGHGKLIYAMRVDEKIPLTEYCRANKDRCDSEREGNEKDRYSLISSHFFYFGRNAIDISEIPTTHLDHPFEKSGPAFRCDFSEAFIEQFANWIKTKFKVGIHGPPCQPHSDWKKPKCRLIIRRKGCDR